MSENVETALKNYFLWLKWHPGDYKGATEFAGCYLDTAEEVDAFEAELRERAGQ
jgi:hypothetical protein